MPKIFVSTNKCCITPKMSAIANYNNMIPPKAANKTNTFISGIFNLQLTSNPVLVKKPDVINPKQTANPPGPGRIRSPRSIYYPPRGINHARKTLLCSDNCNSSVNTEIYKDPFSQCSKDSCYDNRIRTVNNVRGKNIDLEGNLQSGDQTLPNKLYSYDYNQYLKYRKCRYPTNQNSNCSTCGTGSTGNVIGNSSYCENRVPYTKGATSSNPYPNQSFSTNGAVSSGSRIEKLKYDAIRCTPRNKPQDLSNNKQCTKYMGTIKYFQDVNKKQQVCDVPYALSRVRHRSPTSNTSICTSCLGGSCN
jgi:hypothetical protein